MTLTLIQVYTQLYIPCFIPYEHSFISIYLYYIMDESDGFILFLRKEADGFVAIWTVAVLGYKHRVFIPV